MRDLQVKDATATLQPVISSVDPSPTFSLTPTKTPVGVVTKTPTRTLPVALSATPYPIVTVTGEALPANTLTPVSSPTPAPQFSASPVASITATGFPSQTPTRSIAPTHSLTPVISVTATTETPAVSTTPTGQVTETPVIRPTSLPDDLPGEIDSTVKLTLSTTAHYVKKENNFSLQWALKELPAKYPLESLSARVFYPQGVNVRVPAARKDMTLSAGSLVFPLLAATGAIDFAAGSNFEQSNDISFKFQIIEKGKIIAEKKLTMPPSVPVSAKKGGGVNGLEQKLQIRFPEGALKQDIDLISMRLSKEDQLPFDASLYPQAFRIEAYETSSKQTDGPAVRKFEKPITIQYQYDPAAYKGNEAGLGLTYFDEESGSWPWLQSQVDPVLHTLTAVSDHLTIFNPAVQDWTSPLVPSTANFQTSLYTGAATYNLPLTLPDGPAGSSRS